MFFTSGSGWRNLLVILLVFPHRIRNPADPIGDGDVAAAPVLLAAVGAAIEQAAEERVLSHRRVGRLDEGPLERHAAGVSEAAADRFADTILSAVIGLRRQQAVLQQTPGGGKPLDPSDLRHQGVSQDRRDARHTHSGRDKLLTEQSADNWPNTFRIARFYPAVEYVQAARARTLACQQVSALFEKVEHHRRSHQRPATRSHQSHRPPRTHRPQRPPRLRRPAPTKEDDEEHSMGGPNTPVSITFLAGLYQDAKLAAFGHAYQQATGFHKLHPKLD